MTQVKEKRAKSLKPPKPDADTERAKLCEALGFSLEDLDGLEGFDELTAQDLRRAVSYVEEQERDNPLQEFKLEITGETAAAKRPRTARIFNKEGQMVGARVYAADGADQKTLRQEVRAILPKGFIPLEGEVELYLRVYRRMPAGWPPYKELLGELRYLRPETKPDVDNQYKLISDAMNAVLWRDDAQVVMADVMQFFSKRPRLEVVVRGRAKRLAK
jgi:Holliday junction resolvase RusA-like endonuclease